MRRPADGDRTTIERYDPLVGTILDQRFRIASQLAAGGFGAIYRATDVRSDAEVALKVLLPQLAHDAMVVERFRREGKMLASLRDPHTITAYELGEAPDGTLYIVMELLHGTSLYERYRATGPLPWKRVVHIARGVCSSLAEAHAAGVVHRDLKPANIHLETRGNDPDFVKVLDFGIAKIIGPEQVSELTQAGHMIGTVDYMSPEQMVGGELTAASDIYTLGVVMYEMIAGRTPFADAQTPTAILAAVLTRTAEPVSRFAEVPRALDPILARCLERDAALRYADVGELAEDLAMVASRASRPSLSVELDRRRPSRPSVAPSPVPAPSVRPSAPPVAQAPVPAPSLAVPTSGFEDNSLTTEATRIDVRLSDSSLPVLDARGPRVRGDAPMLAGSARGSQHAIDARPMRAPQPVPDSRGSSPLIELAPTTPRRVIATPLPLAGTPYAPRPAPPPSYDMLEARKHDAMVRRIIWLVLFVLSTTITVIVTR
jgi:serine/threonine-protein kinase